MADQAQGRITLATTSLVRGLCIDREHAAGPGASSQARNGGRPGQVRSSAPGQRHRSWVRDPFRERTLISSFPTLARRRAIGCRVDTLCPRTLTASRRSISKLRPPLDAFVNGRRDTLGDAARVFPFCLARYCVQWQAEHMTYLARALCRVNETRRHCLMARPSRRRRLSFELEKTCACCRPSEDQRHAICAIANASGASNACYTQAVLEL
ncbi:hypothetical protein K439DRAFT_1071152 [Ramaria rubella]|nr:hypothetical protein K439DRAFT_108397 [Ramaria rubella]KAF8585245.1 hypothetical protein K439DRAFT_1071068 [Ramaria rubella]KAF8585249.1 hypothetical protein K439DRAFT_1071152 [Ramaria rubella]